MSDYEKQLEEQNEELKERLAAAEQLAKLAKCHWLAGVDRNGLSTYSYRNVVYEYAEVVNAGDEDNNKFHIKGLSFDYDDEYPNFDMVRSHVEKMFKIDIGEILNG